MTKKVASFIAYYYSPHLETDLEIIHSHVSQGDEVTLYICSGELPSCDGNINHSIDVCKHCISRRRNGLNLVDLADKVQLKNFVNLKPSDLDVLNSVKSLKIRTIAELMDVKLENWAMGRTIYNELVSLKNDTEPDLEEMAEYIDNSLQSYALIYLSFKNTFTETRPDIFYTFNGRFVVSAPAIAAARVVGIEFGVHDRSFIMNRYLLVHNESLHSRKYWNDQLDLAWRNSQHNLMERESMAIEWFEARLENKKQGWFSYTADQSQDLPEGFDATKTNIVIFNSSEWEFCGLDEYRLPFYDDQNDGLLKIARDLEGQQNLQIYLRVHPHLKDKANAQNKFVADKITNKFSNFTVIPPESPVKTYNLMKNANVVVTFGSSTGIEAAYQRIPSILLGPAFYENLTACTIVKSHEELLDLLIEHKYKLSSDELDRRKAAALQYAYFQQVAGIPFKIFEQVDIFEMTFEGKQIGRQAPSYEKGLKRELASRAELTGPIPSPLTGLVKELEKTTDKIVSENHNLKLELEKVRQKFESAKQELTDMKTANRNDGTPEPKGSQPTIQADPPGMSSATISPKHSANDLTINRYLKKFQNLIKF